MSALIPVILLNLTAAPTTQPCPPYRLVQIWERHTKGWEPARRNRFHELLGSYHLPAEVCTEEWLCQYDRSIGVFLKSYKEGLSGGSDDLADGYMAWLIWCTLYAANRQPAYLPEAEETLSAHVAVYAKLMKTARDRLVNCGLALSAADIAAIDAALARSAAAFETRARTLQQDLLFPALKRPTSSKEERQVIEQFARRDPRPGDAILRRRPLSMRENDAYVQWVTDFIESYDELALFDILLVVVLRWVPHSPWAELGPLMSANSTYEQVWPARVRLYRSEPCRTTTRSSTR